MTRNAFQAQLDNMNQQLEGMSRLVQGAIAGAVDALIQGDHAAAQRVVAGDRAVNEAYAEIEHICLELLVLQQPMASDLRRIASTLKVITDLERMGDQAVTIAHAVQRVEGRPSITPLVDIPAMATLAQEMVADAVTAFINGDKQRALAMIEKDHEVDRHHKQVIQRLQELMENDRANVGQGIQLLFISHALERIGDHATNLGEWTIYLVTGELEDMNQ